MLFRFFKLFTLVGKGLKLFTLVGKGLKLFTLVGKGLKLFTQVGKGLKLFTLVGKGLKLFTLVGKGLNMQKGIPNLESFLLHFVNIVQTTVPCSRLGERGSPAFSHCPITTSLIAPQTGNEATASQGGAKFTIVICV